MKVEQSTAVKLVLTGLERLDPVTVYLEEFSKDAGRIVIHCWGKAWASFWPAMGGRGIAQFFVDCDNAYLAKNLNHETKAEIHDYEALYPLLMEEINKKLSCPLDEDEQYYFEQARDYLNRNGEIPHDLKEGEFWCWDNGELLSYVFGSEWWNEIPKMTNPEYVYLCRIIDAVRNGLAQMLADKAAEIAIKSITKSVTESTWLDLKN